MAGNGKRLTTKDRQALYDLLITRHRTGLTDEDIAHRMGVSRATIAKYKVAFLKQQPELAPILLGKRLAAADVAEITQSSDPLAVAQALTQAATQAPPALIQAGEGLTIPQMLTVLADLAQNGGQPYRVQAIKALADLQAAYKPEAHLGPPPPLTDEERVVRLSRILDCCTPKVIAAALERVQYAPAP